MNKRLKLVMIRMLCTVLVVGTFAGATPISYAASQVINHSQLGTHDFEFKYTSFEAEGAIYMGGSSGAAGLINSFVKYPIPASGFPAIGQKAVLSLNVSDVHGADDPNFAQQLQIWQYIGSTPFNANDDNSWPTSLGNLGSNPNFLLLDTKSASDIKKGVFLTFDVDKAVKSRAGSQVELLITGAASATPNREEVRVDSFQAPYLTEIAGAAPASASQSTVSVSSAAVTADGTSSATVTVTVKDASGNPLNSKTVTLSKGASSSVVSPASQVTNMSGVATFTVTNTKAEQATYTAAVAADSVIINQTAVVTFVPGAISSAKSTVTATPTIVDANGTSSSTITVTAKDANENVISGKTFMLSQGGGSSLITATQETTDSSGIATFTVTSTKAEVVTYTAESDAVSLSTKPTVTFRAGAADPTQSTVTVSKPNVIANNVDSAAITVTIKDANSNPVNGQAVTLTQGSGSSTLTPAQGMTDASGVASFTVKSTKAESTTYTAAVGGTPLANTVGVTF